MKTTDVINDKEKLDELSDKVIQTLEKLNKTIDMKDIYHCVSFVLFDEFKDELEKDKERLSSLSAIIATNASDNFSNLFGSLCKITIRKIKEFHHENR